MADDQPDKEDKTEEPTQRRLDQALERGDVAKSIEIYTLFVLASGTLVVMLAGPWLSGVLVRGLAPFLANAHAIPVDAAGAMRITAEIGLVLAVVCGAPFLALFLSGIASGLVQHRPVWSTEQLEPKLDRINPIAGFKRIYGKEAIALFLKGLFKIAIVGAAILWTLWSERAALEAFARREVQTLLPETLWLILKLLGSALGIFVFLALADYGYQRWQWFSRQRMTREELKREFKETEGSPEIKQKVRQLRAQVARKRMMAAVPKASVIITNPTHYAVALRYEPGMNAPVCVAKGVDSLALRIREVATGAAVPIVENPPLARALHATVEIDAEIAPEHYKAVAEVIGYVMQLSRRRA
jgi:flagellar biosynthetic protein FlhB